MDIWVTGIVMAGLGYWAAHIRLTSKRRMIVGLLTEARDILTRMESDRGKTTEELNKATALTNKAEQLVTELEADRSNVGGDDKHTAV